MMKTTSNKTVYLERFLRIQMMKTTSIISKLISQLTVAFEMFALASVDQCLLEYAQ